MDTNGERVTMSDHSENHTITMVRNRGRGRARSRLCHQTDEASKPASTSDILMNSTKTGLSSAALYVDTKSGQFEDPVRIESSSDWPNKEKCSTNTSTPLNVDAKDFNKSNSMSATLKIKATNGQTATLNNHIHNTNHITIQVRNRGKGRARSRLCCKTDETSKPASANDILTNFTNTGLSNAAHNVDTKPGPFEDVLTNQSLSECLSTEKHFKDLLSNGSLSACPNKEKQFEELVPNGSLSEKDVEKHSVNITSSSDVDVQPSFESPVPQPLYIDIPPQYFTCSKKLAPYGPVENVPPFRKRLLLKMQHLSMTEPPSLWPRLEVFSSTSGTKSKLGSQARGRARKKHTEMEATSRPGAVTDGSTQNCSKSHAENMVTNSEQFSDAIEDIADSNSHQNTLTGNILHSSGQQRASPGSVSVSLGKNGSSAKSSSSSDTPGLPAGSNSKPSDAGRSRSPPNGDAGAKHSNTKGLTLNLGASESIATDGASVSSPLPDDITLWSPNHEYVLDWAAAMATPDVVSDNPPDWNA